MARFEKGRSGNPAGRKKGSRDKRSAWRTELAAELPEILARLTALAKDGDLEAMRLILARTCPPLRATGTPVELPALARAKTPSAQARAIIEAVAKGALSPDTAADLLGALSSAVRVVEVTELAERIKRLESGSAGGPDGDA